MWLNTDDNKNMAGTLYSRFGFTLPWKFRRLSVTWLCHIWTSVNHSQILQAASGFYPYLTGSNKPCFVISHHFSGSRGHLLISRRLLLSVIPTCYHIFIKYLLQHSWPIWNLSFQNIYSWIDEYETWISIKSHIYICK